MTAGIDGQGLNASVVLDGGPPMPVVASRQLVPPGTTTYNNLIFSSIIQPGNHTVVLTNLNGVAFYVDYFLIRADSQGSAASSATSASILPSSTSSPLASSQKSKSFPTTAVIGGALGGLAVLVLALIGVFMWKRRAETVLHPGEHIFLWESYCSEY